eukprot:TCONS_00000879-protein
MELQETTLRNTNTICDASDTGVQKDKHQKKTDMLSSDMETNTNHGSTEEMTMLKIDDFLRMVGEFGPFQWILELWCIFLYIAPVSQIYIMYFTTPEPPAWRCVNGSSLCNLNGTQPSDNNYRCEIPRSQWEYVQGEGVSTVTVDYDLVCDSKWLISMTSSIFYFGKLFGTFCAGWLADNYGRKTVLYPSNLLLLSASLLTTLMPNIWSFLVCRFIAGFATDATTNQALLLLSEYVSTKYRPIATNILWMGWIGTLCLMPLQAYFIKQWKMLFVVAVVPYVIGFLSYFFIPESVRWLRTKERYSDAKSILRRMARWNHKELDETAGIERPIISTKRTTPLDLFRRNLVVSTLAQGCLWFVNGLVYYGLSLSADDLGGSMYLNFVYVSLAEIPSAICAADFSNRFGRKRTTVVALILAGVFCISVPYIPLTEAGKPSRLAVGLLGKFFLTLSFDIITIWSVELFPTDLRSKGLSFVYMCGNVGSTASPWIAKGLKVFSDEVPFIVMGVSALVGGAVGLLLEETNGRDAKDTLNEFLADGVDNKEVGK